MLIYSDVAELTESEWEEFRRRAIEVFFEVGVGHVDETYLISIRQNSSPQSAIHDSALCVNWDSENFEIIDFLGEFAEFVVSTTFVNIHRTPIAVSPYQHELFKLFRLNYHWK